MKKYRLIALMGASVAAVFLVAAQTGAAAAQTGAQVYSANCASCHQAKGQGLPGTFPPLAHNSFVTGKAQPVVDTILNGKNGAITVNGRKYNGSMPAWKTQLSKADIASVATYIRTSWGNNASKVTTAQVK
jgi:mono/diheme cytochrome c family protein